MQQGGGGGGHGSGMATDNGGGNPADRTRHVYGPRPIGALVPAITRPAFKQRSPAAAQVLADWANIAGPELAARAVPRRIVGGTLTLGCTGPVALELQHVSAQVIDRVNAHLGRQLIERLRFIQDPPRPLAALPARRPPGPPVLVPGLPPGALRDALAALGAAVQDTDPADPA